MPHDAIHPGPFMWYFIFSECFSGSENWSFRDANASSHRTNLPASLINMLQRDSCNDVRGWDLSETHPAYQECKDAATGFNSLPEGVRTRCTYTIRPKCRGFPKKVCSVLIVRSLLNPCRWGLGLQGRTVSLAWCAQPLNLGNNGGNQANQADDVDPPAIPGFANIPGFDEVGRK
ncbi:unnamed protein product [Bemisia tabaci]|uniref:Uncharacterized protein n=1 Tax=Bemisia tabaci TaxID=7038 RepID=A0A9P0A1G8_BEMTA|nr:unnamed protein product [Bemisia tabaci]